MSKFAEFQDFADLQHWSVICDSLGRTDFATREIGQYKISLIYEINRSIDSDSKVEEGTWSWLITDLETQDLYSNMDIIHKHYLDAVSDAFNALRILFLSNNPNSIDTE